MKTRVPANVDEYIADCPAEVREVLKQIRSAIRKAAPAAEETISYRMPAYRLNGPLMRAIAPYANERGNLRFPLDQQIPYTLITRIVKARMRENTERAAVRKAKGRQA